MVVLVEASNVRLAAFGDNARIAEKTQMHIVAAVRKGWFKTNR